jgi:DNA-binding XRE family transcriptional regulator
VVRERKRPPRSWQGSRGLTDKVVSDLAERTREGDQDEPVGRHIRRLRAAAHLTQAELAAGAGVSLDLIRKLEQEQRYTASVASLHKIARALDVDTGELLSKTTALPAHRPGWWPCAGS